MTYRDTFDDHSKYYNHAHHTIGSNNLVRLSIGEIAGSASGKYLTLFCIALIVGAIVYLCLTALIVVQGLIAFGVGVIVWQGSMWCVRSFSDTQARITYNQDQKERNRILSHPNSKTTVVKDKFDNIHLHNGGYTEYRYNFDTPRQADNVVDAEYEEIPVDPFEQQLDDEG
jgi:hypothetical protein